MDNNEIIRLLYRSCPKDNANYFSENIQKLLLNSGDDSLLTDRKLKSLLKIYKTNYNYDLSIGIVPLFEIVDENTGEIAWCYNSKSNPPYKNKWLKIRYDVYKYIDNLDDRQFEALACVVCELLGAKNVLLTERGNEGGIDFVSSISFSNESHYLFGMKGPLRIIGQCKKYSAKVQVNHLKEFVTTIDQVYNWSFRAGEVLPIWFKESSGTIISWHISYMGHQSGALDLAKSHGIVTSDVKELVEVLAKSKQLRNSQNIESTLNELIEKYL